MTDVTLESFLSDIWGSEDNTVYLATKQSETLFKVSSPLVWPENKSLILQAIVKSNANWDTYYTPGTFKPGTNTKEKNNGLRAHCLWLDIDGYKDGVAGPERVLQAIRDTGWLPMPTYQLQTSDSASGHFYWVLDGYYPANVISDLNRRLAYFLGGDKACWDISHVMRPPYTHNHKDIHKVDGISPQVTIAHYNEEAYAADLFDKLPLIKEQIKDNVSFGELPSIDEVKMKYPWPKDAMETFHRDKQHFWNEEAGDFQSRGNAMMNLAYNGAEVGMPDEAIYTVLLDVDERWGKFKDRHDRQTRLVEMITKVRAKYPSSIFTKYVSDTETIIKPFYTFKDFMASEFKFNWIYQDVIGEQSINFISARPGAGKSRFILQLSRSLALGQNFLGWKIVGGPRKVLVLSLEMGPPILKKFLGHIQDESTEEEVELFSDNFVVVPAGEPLAIATAEGKQFLDMVMDEVKPDVVMIDAMGSLDFDELSEKTSKSIMNTLKGYLNTHKVTFYMVHHNKKADAASINKPPTLNDFYGNTYGATDAGNITALWKNPASSVELTELHTLKARLGIEPKPLVLNSHSSFMFTLAGEEEPYHANNKTSRNDKAKEPTHSSKPSTSFSAFG